MRVSELRMAAAAVAMAAYRAAWRAAGPLVALVVRRRDRLRGVRPAVAAERFGWSEQPAAWRGRNAGFTLWIHGASVGECLSALPLVELALAGRLAPAAAADTRVLLTTTTPAARSLLQERLARLSDARARCVFAPVDHPVCVRRFLETWRPDAGLWVESELWPTLVAEAKRRRVAVGLVNARMSPRSLRRWRLPVARSVAQRLLGAFSLVLTQDEQNQERFVQLGATRAECLVNLKFASAAKLLTGDGGGGSDDLRVAIGGRPVWAAVSTHEGEEELMAAAHVGLAAQPEAKDVLTVVIPRHPERASAIVEMLGRKFPDVRVGLRSELSAPSRDTSIFIVDTLGETKRFFNAIHTVVMGGSFVTRGGHNPLEPLHAGCQVLVGPHMDNFADIMRQLQLGGFGEGSEARRAVQELATADVSALVAALRPRLLSPVDEDAQEQQKRALATLASVSLSSYEKKLREWLSGL